MRRVRKDSKGRVLHKGESFKKKQQLYCYYYVDYLGKQRYIYDRDLGCLRDKEKQLERDRSDGLDLYAIAKSDINYVFDRYISTRTELRKSTMNNYLYTYDKYVRKGFGNKKVALVKYSDVLIYYNKLIDSGLSISTVESVHTCLHPAFNMAVRDSVIRHNPSDGVMAELKKKLKQKNEARHPLSMEEQRIFLSLLDSVENIRWKALFTVMFGTGARIGEIIGLRWEDVDFNNNMISINHTITYYPNRDNNGKCEFKAGPPKTKAGNRTVPMLDKVREVLIWEKNNQRTMGYHCLSKVDGMSGFIFCNRFGTLHNPSGVNRAIKRIVDDYNSQEELKAKRASRKAVLLPRFSCHITRHTFCTRLCENETNIKVIQTVMGHNDIQTTLGIYAEVSEQKRQEEFRKLNGHNVF